VMYQGEKEQAGHGHKLRHAKQKRTNPYGLVRTPNR